MSLSARPLAAAARLAGRVCFSIDLFADLDTRAHTRAAIAVPAHRHGHGFAPAALLAAADRLDPQRRCPVVYGSGFEAAPRLLTALCQQRPLLGNPPKLLGRLSQAKQRAALLAELAIPHPEVCFTPPTRGRWLVKRAGGCGGGHVQPWPHDTDKSGNVIAPDPRRYWQRRVAGRCLSATLLSDGRRVRVVGYCLQWPQRSPERPFGYAGAVSLPAGPPGRLRAELQTAACKLVSATGLRGLWCVDLIVSRRNDRWWLLEINPRPGMSFELHGDPGALFAAHLYAADPQHGRLATGIRPAVDRTSRGHALVFATDARTVGNPHWPDWTADRPAPGTRLAPGEPLCTVYADGADPAQVRARLRRRRRLASRLDTR